MSQDLEFARARSHQDAKVAAGMARSAAWAALLLNGGAAGAVLMVGPPMAGVASFALTGFALGALFGVLMLFALFHWVERRNLHWETIARGQGQAVTDAARARATRLAPAVSINFALSILGFIVGAVALIGGMMSLSGPAQ
jgi:hypothetical protein